MGVRELRLCDAKDDGTDSGEVCNGIYKGTCAVCKADCCAHHLGGTDIRSQISLCEPDKSAYVLGGQQINFRVCTACTVRIRQAMNKREHTIRHVIKTDPEEILSAIRARLTEHALTEKAAPKGFQPGVPSSLLDTDV